MTPIDEQGPLEIRRAARAFNLMQERIARSMRDRSRMLAAISHDLRTPLTRMRLLAETGEPSAMKDRLLRNVAQMQAMTASALSFLSGGFDEEEREPLDLAAAAADSCATKECEESGTAVRYIGPERLEYFCRPNSMARAASNLIENARHFGAEVTVRAEAREDELVVSVEDDGPRRFRGAPAGGG